MTGFDSTIIKTILESQKENIEDIVIINKNMSNGDVIKAMFPYLEISNGKGLSKVYTGIPYGEFIGANIDCMKEWWNAPYKGGD